MTKFLLFSHTTYDASGGWGDLVGVFDNIDEAKQEADRCEDHHSHQHIVSTETFKVVICRDKENFEEPYGEWEAI